MSVSFPGPGSLGDHPADEPPSPPPTTPSDLVELAQRHALDVVLAAGLFKPNAGGFHELSPSGFQRRQILKGSRRYHGERVVLAVTPLQVIALELGFGGIVRSTVTWSRSSLAVRRTRAQGAPEDPEWPAFEVADRRALPSRIEVAIRMRDAGAAAVMQLLGLRPRLV